MLVKYTSFRLKGLTGKDRDVAQLKGFWRRIKRSARENVSDHKRAVGNSIWHHSSPSASPDDLKIKEICPTNFTTEENNFDSNGVYQNTVS